MYTSIYAKVMLNDNRPIYTPCFNELGLDRENVDKNQFFDHTFRIQSSERTQFEIIQAAVN